MSAKKPEQQISAIVEELTAASRGTISDLKSLLQSAEDADHARQLENEREAQIRRIAALMREST